jgi:enoyl-[acyl-carrier-protein] reductase (NADH)
LHGLTKVMSRELAAAGILTNVVMAGFVPAGKPVPDPVIQMARNAAAIGRVSHAREIADLIVFLCSARNTNITGQAIRADGHFLTPMSNPNPHEQSDVTIGASPARRAMRVPAVSEPPVGRAVDPG